MFAWMRQRKEADALIDADARALIAQFGEGAYYESRRRALGSDRRHTIDANRPPGHWNRVRSLIGKRTGRDYLDTATRYLEKT